MKKVKILYEIFSRRFEKFDNRSKMEYNRGMEKIKIAIIGGGAAGLFLYNALTDHTGVVLFEKGERLGRKLSATGNGQGNITNLSVKEAEYFSVRKGKEGLIRSIVAQFDDRHLRTFFEEKGVLTVVDERGRVYPAGRQASALTDALRFSAKEGVLLQADVIELKKQEDGFLLTYLCSGEKKQAYAEKVALCAGGKAAKNFGTDGKAYALAVGLGHSVTPLYPSLVQLKTDTAYIKTLKGIRATAVLRAKTPTRELSAQGDIIFTDYGVSGDAVFRLSAFFADEIEKGGCRLSIDFLPEFTKEELRTLLQNKKKSYPDLPLGELLFGVVNNQVGRAIFRRADNDIFRAVELVKNFSLTVTGSLGFDYAQVTKGGIPLNEVNEKLESVFAKGLYFAGEILDADGQCGGFNLQWAYASARKVAETLNEEGGQVCV